MKVVGIKNLKNRLSEYVHLAASGETVLVTERDKVVAELTAPSPGRGAKAPDALLAEAVRQGWLTPPLLVDATLPPRKPVTTLHRLLAELDQDRADR